MNLVHGTVDLKIVSKKDLKLINCYQKTWSMQLKILGKFYKNRMKNIRKAQLDTQICKNLTRVRYDQIL